MYTYNNPSTRVIRLIFYSRRQVPWQGLKSTLSWSETTELEFGALNHSATTRHIIKQLIPILYLQTTKQFNFIIHIEKLVSRHDNYCFEFRVNFATTNLKGQVTQLGPDNENENENDNDKNVRPWLVEMIHAEYSHPLIGPQVRNPDRCQNLSLAKSVVHTRTGV